MRTMFKSSLIAARAAATNSSSGFDFDPILHYRPPFSRSLPVQLLLIGIVLTLVAILLIHLIFTATYHWPHAPVNFVLQLCGVVSLFITLVATMYVALSATHEESKQWPYMLSYLAVSVPLLGDDLDDLAGWNMVEKVTWLLMDATTAGVIQITHIQFLTLLFPSTSEARLIYSLLGPLAILAAVMQLLPLVGDARVTGVAAGVRNVCNATLSLLFTLAIFIWGLLVNRGQAWRTDGGTAVFGISALVLTVISTGLNFVHITVGTELLWLPGIIWAVILWQNFFGWWWWVGAGSRGGKSVEAKLKRHQKKEMKKREIEDKKKARAKNAQPLHQPLHPPQLDRDSDTSSTWSSVTIPSRLFRFLPIFAQRWWSNLQRAHVTATHVQAVERVERIQRDGGTGVDGWGLGNFRSANAVTGGHHGDHEEKEMEWVDAGAKAAGTERSTPRTSISSSKWFWGPLRKWRLRDSTAY